MENLVENNTLKKWNFIPTNNSLTNIIAKHFHKKKLLFEKIYIKGTLLNRMIIVIINKNKALLIYLGENTIEYFFKNKIFNIKIDNPRNKISYAKISDNDLKKLNSPSINIINLYKKEFFPMPRFPLGISDLANSIRYECIGEVKLTDMQFIPSLQDVIKDLTKNHYDIIGISATFGQYDLLTKLLSTIFNGLPYKPLVIVGGSLASLTRDFILNKFNKVIIVNGYGEITIQNIIKYWHNIIPIDKINNISYFDKSKKLIQETTDKKESYEYIGIPELDLLPETLKNKGIIILESSRGCTGECSFCPRKHKGNWDNTINVNNIIKLMPYIDNLYSEYKTTKKLFYVDEEFVGYHSIKSFKNLADKYAQIYHSYGFKFEGGTRIDQIYQPKKGRKYNIEKMKVWKHLKENGLNRCLFGVESGVNSILQRFNKKTNYLQNIYGTRILTALDIPIRITYITFDPFMTMDELKQSYIFQGRKDIILKPLPNISMSELFDAIHDENFVKNNNISAPLYTEISYMLVSLEGFINSPYLLTATNNNMVSDYNLLMGRANIKYKNKTIGMFAYLCQAWIDRNFHLDYTLKGLMKLTVGTTFYSIKEMRTAIKKSAYILLGKLIAIATEDINLVKIYCTDLEIQSLKNFSNLWKKINIIGDKNISLLYKLFDEHFIILTDNFEKIYNKAKKIISEEDTKKINDALLKWKNKSKQWDFINPVTSSNKKNIAEII